VTRGPQATPADRTAFTMLNDSSAYTRIPADTTGKDFPVNNTRGEEAWDATAPFTEIQAGMRNRAIEPAADLPALCGNRAHCSQFPEYDIVNLRF